MMTVRRGAVLDAAMDFWRKWLVAAALGLVGLTLCLSSASLPAKSRLAPAHMLVYPLETLKDSMP